MTTLHLALPPNILRKVVSDVAEAFPNAIILPPNNHEEMDRFFRSAFGMKNETADLTVTAYPAALTRARSLGGKSVFRHLSEALTPIRPELAEIGYREVDPFCKVIAVVPFLMICHKSVSQKVAGWSDLCRDELAEAMVIPPANTPAPATFASYMTTLFGNRGKEAAARVNASLLPLEINNSVDKGEFKIGLALPAFSQTFREGNAVRVWPVEGAVTLPLLAFIKKNAPEDAEDVLRFLLSETFQTFISHSGLLIPVRQGVSLFQEMTLEIGRLNWLGWDKYSLLA